MIRMAEERRERLLHAARVGSTGELAAAVVLVCGFPLLLTASLLGQVGLFAAVGAATYLADHFLHRRASYLLSRMAKARAGLGVRFLLRHLMLVLLLTRLDLADSTALAAISCFVAFHGLQVPHSALSTLLRNRHKLPVATVNIDLTRLGVPAPPPQALLHRGAEKMQHLDLFAVAGVLAAAAGAPEVTAYAGIGATLGLATLYVLALAAYLRRGKLPPRREKVLEWFDGWLAEHQPDTVLYFSGSPESTYQVSMWLETMEDLTRRGLRPLVLLRERYTLETLAPTTVPVACVPSAVHLMNFDLSMLRVALYPANVGKNIHLLREPTMKHVFVGHGDSDKIASVNPYSKVYDEVWTAGRAGRDRYATANVGVRDEDIVEVGRPQLAPVMGGPLPRAGSVPTVSTVLYAPTWEGWTDDPGNTSLILAGEHIVRALLQSPDPVRVMYKPHPFTGTRSPLAREAHEQITAMIHAAGGDHQVITGPEPKLYDCFNAADALVSDISSVVSDWIASGRPYAVTDSAELGEEEFRRQNTAVRAAVILDNRANGVGQLLAALRDPASDPLAAARTELKTYLLGPTGTDPLARFELAVKELATKAGLRNLESLTHE
ncbi:MULTISPECIES: CDP-glycerol glycerophosphotransferase family protein [unclassified Streptomyces]|uniref:CDP-glycerol glycerophosphotransferase family protein n=1 Tax=unclassified Streptomyces TaxID=2593676 RepID=UPI002DDAF37C|nr:CDP-glycerol glycerophosphotransferase family protein [Streptomyces sp. NBC_01795]WSA90819.1 CDP-glycerol glycerophosphotransferase family protein [Streptomyces sp. NBC_01795]WSS45393.1 CDP-glycerol glycerophosphotransferase family protein [Streptomyces sp. NBC_01187]